jgi:hypothetical protein
MRWDSQVTHKGGNRKPLTDTEILKGIYVGVKVELDY